MRRVHSPQGWTDAPRRWLLTLLFLTCGSMSAQAGVIYHLGTTHAVPGAEVQVQGVLFNDTGNPLSTPIPKTLEGQWADAEGHAMPARFALATSPDPAELPANTFTRMVWTGHVPPQARGPLTLHLQDADYLLALQTEGGGTEGQTASDDASPAESATPHTVATTDHTQATTPSTPPSLAATAPPFSPTSPFDRFRNAISPYDPIYFVAGRNGGATARFQLSFKYRLFSPENAQKPHFMDNWYLGYTQTSLWDLHSDSIPFVDTTYNPSLFWTRESLWQTKDQRWFIGVNSGFEHKSNGKAGDDSRSLNDLYIQPELNHRFDSGSTLTFSPRFKYYVWTDPDMRYPDSLGHVDWKLRWAQDDGLVLSGLYRQGRGSHNATQLEAAWPLKRTFLHMNGYLYVQYFRGYSETLLDYNQKHDPQLRIGIALVP